MSIRGGQSNMSGMERQVSYDSSTHWTKQGKPVEQSEFKEGWFVIVLGHADEKGNLHASRIDLRLPRSLYRRLGTALYQHTDAALPLPLSQGHRDVVDLCQRKQGIGQTEI